MTETNPVVRRYLDQLELGLRTLPDAERTEIVREINSHIAEAVNSGRSLAEVLERLGPADRLARAFMAESILGGPGRPWRKWLAAAIIVAGSSAAGLFLIPFLAIFGLLFPVAGALGIVGNTLYLIYGEAAAVGLPRTDFPSWNQPGWPQVIGIFIQLASIVLGLGALRLLKGYILFVIKSVRSTLN